MSVALGSVQPDQAARLAALQNVRKAAPKGQTAGHLAPENVQADQAVVVLPG